MELSLGDIESILETLIYDDKIDIKLDGEVKTYIYRPHFGSVLGIDSMPCGVCPVAKDCSDDGPINPSSCVYYTNWLASEAYQF